MIVPPYLCWTPFCWLLCLAWLDSELIMHRYLKPQNTGLCSSHSYHPEREKSLTDIISLLHSPLQRQLLTKHMVNLHNSITRDAIQRSWMD
jgi:hypothetical protein